jgi:hypothetical protein
MGAQAQLMELNLSGILLQGAGAAEPGGYSEAGVRCHAQAGGRHTRAPGAFLQHAVGASFNWELRHRCTHSFACTGVWVGVCCHSCMHAGNRRDESACLLQVDDLMRALERLQTLQSEAKTAAVHARV